MFAGMLSSYKVLDLADQKGMFCGYILAHLGAEVIAVEPPGGGSARALAPFAHGGNGVESSLWWQAYGRGKSSLVLDLESKSGGARLRELAAGADVLIESFSGADARRLGLDYETLAAVNPGLVCVSLSPFGRTGPKADWPATDLTVWASSGAHILAGDDDRAPVRTSVPQSFLHAGADAACAALIALEARHRTGLGQQVDVSAQQSSAQAALGMILAAPNNGGFAVRRVAGGLRGTFPIRFSFPCRDGYVTITLMFGHAFEEPNRKLLRWLHEHGACSVEDVTKNWIAEVGAIEAGERPVDGYLELCARIEAFTLARTQQELFREGLERGVYIAPAFDIAGKLGVTVDPGHPAGREVILDLVRWADVVTESFSPKAMKAWNLDYPVLREVNPSLIMLSSCLMGQSGPRAMVPGYGNMASALAGFHNLTGWPDRSPAGPFLAYTDTISPRIMVASLLAALEHRRLTGEGQHIDVSQAEAAIHLLAPAILDYEANGRIWRRMGNRDMELCPHGVYPARGEDRWVAVACQSDAAWQALGEVMGLDEAAADPELATAEGRRQRADELDGQVAGWTCSRDEREVESALVAAGVAAHVVQNTAECAADPQLRHRNHFRTVANASAGELVVEGSPFQLSRTPARVGRAGPELGEHNFRVLEEILGYHSERIADLLASGAMR